MTCTWCGKGGAQLKRRDAGNALHRFHGKCWLAFMRWLSSPGKRPAR